MPRVDTAVLQRFQPWSGTVPAGFFAYFLGNLTRADYWAFPKAMRAEFERERHETFSAPASDDNIFDWVVLLEAVSEARGSFTMAAAGAGWGRWLVAAALAARQVGIEPVKLVGIEAEPTHFRWMREHFRDNGLEPAAHDLIEAAVSGRSGEVWFSVGEADSWYGQSIVEAGPGATPDEAGEIVVNGHRTRRVPTLDLGAAIGAHGKIDYLHMDVQGAELEFLASDPALLNRTVRRVLIGTHSADIERGLRELFAGLGWRNQYDVPLNGQVLVSDVVVTVGDGVQSWINPRL